MVGIRTSKAVRDFSVGLWLAIVLTGITWIAEEFQGYLLQQWVLTALYFVWPLGLLMAVASQVRSGQSSENRQLTGSLSHSILPWLYYGFVGFVTCGALALVGELCGWTSLRAEFGALLVLALILPFFGYFVYRKPILWIALVPAIVVTLFAGILPRLRGDGDWWPLLTALLPILALLAAPWSGLGWLLLHCAEKSHIHRRLGPLTEFVSLMFLFVPLMYSVWVLGENLPDSETWKPVCITIIGVLMSIIASDPLRRFLKACWDPCLLPRGCFIHRQAK